MSKTLEAGLTSLSSNKLVLEKYFVIL